MKKELLEHMRQLEEPQLYCDLYTDSLTGVLNRRAFDLDYRKIVAIVDLDSLKYVNDSYGHRHGDFLLEELAHVLIKAFGDKNVYRIGGDEFAIKSEVLLELRQTLSQISTEFPGFSSGVGVGIQQADKYLNKDKNLREQRGERASRGECPPWLKQFEEKTQCL